MGTRRDDITGMDRAQIAIEVLPRYRPQGLVTDLAQAHGVSRQTIYTIAAAGKALLEAEMQPGPHGPYPAAKKVRVQSRSWDGSEGHCPYEFCIDPDNPTVEAYSFVRNPAEDPPFFSTDGGVTWERNWCGNQYNDYTCQGAYEGYGDNFGKADGFGHGSRFIETRRAL